MIRSLIVAAALALAPAAVLSTPAYAQQTPPASADAKLKVFVDQLLTFVRPYQVLMDETNEVIVLSMDGMNRALDMSDNGSTDDAWVPAWEKDVKTRSDAIRAKVPGLPSLPAAELEAMIKEAPELRPRIAALLEIEDAYKATIMNGLEYATSVTPDVRRVADGDEDAFLPLHRKIIAGTRLITRSENTMLKLQIAAAGAQSPQGAVARSAMLTNEVLEDLLVYQEEYVAGREPDGKALARTLLEKAKTVRTGAAAIVREARAMEGKVALFNDPVLRGKLVAILKTFDENAEIELKMAADIEALAARLEQGEEALEAMGPLLDEMDAATMKRNAVQQKRTDMMGR